MLRQSLQPLQRFAIALPLVLLMGGCPRSPSQPVSSPAAPPAQGAAPSPPPPPPSPVTPASAKPSPPASSTTNENALFRPILSSLQSKTRIPILLPTNLPQQMDVPLNALHSILDEANSSAYQVQVAFTPDCLGQAVCSLGTLAGETVTEQAPPLTGESVSLGNNRTAYFVDVNPDTCGAGYCYSSLTWEMDLYRYTISMKAADPETLVQLANSAIRAEIRPSANSPQAQTPAVAANPRSLNRSEMGALQQVFPNRQNDFIPEQTFRVNLNSFGSTELVPLIERSQNGLTLSLNLVKDDRIIYTFPTSTVAGSGMPFFALDAVAFRDVNQDGFMDVIAIARYAPQPSAAQAVPGAVVYLGGTNGFNLDESLNQQLSSQAANTVAKVLEITKKQF